MRSSLLACRQTTLSKIVLVVSMAGMAAGCSSSNARLSDGPLFAGSAASQAPAPIESRDLNPIGTGAAAYAAADPITTPNALRERGWSVEGAPIVEVTSADTAATLSAGFGVPVSVILEANGLTSPDQVRPGQRLVVPTYVRVDNPNPAPTLVAQMPSQPKAPLAAPTLGAPPTTLNAQAGESRHIVQNGDTLYSIATAYRVPPQQVAALNDLPPDGTVRTGQALRIPSATMAGNGPVEPKAMQVASLTPPAGAAATLNDATPAIAQEAAVSRPVAPDVVDDGGTGFRWPVKGRIITGFGKQADGARNDGINLAVPAGTPVRAAEEGTVIYAGNELEGYGNLILVQHADDWVSAYAHNSELKVHRGDKVKRGQTIAAVGKSGSVDQPQLHFELRRKSKPVDPLPHLAGA